MQLSCEAHLAASRRWLFYGAATHHINSSCRAVAQHLSTTGVSLRHQRCTSLQNNTKSSSRLQSGRVTTHLPLPTNLGAEKEVINIEYLYTEQRRDVVYPKENTRGRHNCFVRDKSSFQHKHLNTPNHLRNMSPRFTLLLPPAATLERDLDLLRTNAYSFLPFLSCPSASMKSVLP